ncbi:sensor histidine kinase [Actinomadura rupiterrae]|uniref:sensor histidine kinase n=1 Tax=Actinomadura rupiterrae TaxID=559627 RepID=UPI0020A58481|nr:sensor histidine kinase [Actinomadura rupiterrae]MCP2340312.1 two-component system sensor histidine kinase DesK [Actinomadura rupiterrae]
MNRLFKETIDGEDPGRSRLRRAFWAAFGLVYIVPLVKVIAGYHGSRLVLAVLALVLFVAVYVATPLTMSSWMLPASRRTYVLFGVFAALCAGLPLAFGHEWVGMPIYLAIIAAMTLPLRVVPYAIAASALLGSAQCLLLDVGRGGLLTITMTALSIGLFMFAFRHARTLVQQLREARAETTRLAAANERLRIARDLHDLLGHSLSLIVLKSELARRMAPRDVDRAIAEVNDIESVAREALRDVRATISGYRRRDLTGELDGARAVLTAAGIEPVVRTSGTPLPDEADSLFGWAVREAVTNVVRHSRARRCEIDVRREPDAAVLTVTDDGTATEASFAPGNGLTGLAERMESAGGTVTARPRPSGGFGVAVRLPLSPADAAGAAPEPGSSGGGGGTRPAVGSAS